MTAGVVAYRQLGYPVGGGDAAVESAGAFGGLGRVLGHVASDLGVCDVAGGGNRADIKLASPCQRAGWEAGGSGRPYVDGVSGLIDGGSE